MPKNLPSLSDQLKKAIENCGLTRYELSKRSGVTQSALSRFVRGERGLSSDAFDKIGKVLGIELLVRDIADASPKRSKRNDG